MSIKNFSGKLCIILFALFWSLWSFPQASTAQDILRPTAFNDYAGITINQSNAFDDDLSLVTSADISTSEDAFPSIIYHTWLPTTNEYSSLKLNVNRSSIGHTDDKWGITYSTNNGISWMSLDNMSSQNIGQSDISVDLDPLQELSQLQVRIDTDRRKKADNAQVHIYDIWVEEEIAHSPGIEQSGYRFFEAIDSDDFYEKVSGAPGDDRAKAIAIDFDYMYVAGFKYIRDIPEEPGRHAWYIEKRDLTEGNLVYSKTSEDNWSEANAIAIDNTYMYVAGHRNVGGNYEWRIEKRLLNDGSLVAGFGSGGVIISDPSGNSDTAYGIAVDDEYIYVVGSDRSLRASDAQWRIEKRDSVDGSMVDEIVVNFSADNDIPYAIAIDSTYMYVVGYDRIPGSSNKPGKGNKGSSNAEWRIEKRSLSDLSVLQGSTYSNPTDNFDSAKGIAIDSSYIYVIGYQELGYFDTAWHIEKRNRNDLSLNLGFDNDGIIIEDYGYDDRPTAIAVDSSYMYIAGFSSDYGSGGDTAWRIEKRGIDNGSLLEEVVNDIDSEDNDRAFAIAVDSSYMYVAGYSNSGFPGYLPDWRIVKRELSDLSLDLLENLSALDEPIVLINDSEFRLKMLLHISSEPLPQDLYHFKLQYAEKDINCGNSTYQDITDQTPIAFKDNPIASDGTAIFGSGEDPSHFGHTTHQQTFEKLNNFTNSESAIGAGEDGLWDFSLFINNANLTTYCFRIIRDDSTPDGAELDLYIYPEVTVNDSP